MSFTDLFKQQLDRRRVVELMAEDAIAELAAPETEAERAARVEREAAIAEARDKALASFAVHKPQLSHQTDESTAEPSIDDLTDEELERAVAEAQALEAAKIPESEALTAAHILHARLASYDHTPQGIVRHNETEEAACTQMNAPPRKLSSSNSSPTKPTGKLKGRGKSKSGNR